MSAVVVLIFANCLCASALSTTVEAQQLSHVLSRSIRQASNSSSSQTQVTEMNIAFDLPDITATVQMLSGSVQLEAFKSVNNDKIDMAGTKTSQLFWVSIGHPHFVKTEDQRNPGVMKFFHSSDRGFTTYVQVMTDEQRAALVTAAHNKYQVEIADRQVVHLILAKFYCNIVLYDAAGNRYLLSGNISDFRHFPLRMDFDILTGRIERALFSKLINESEDDLRFECHIESFGGKLTKSNTLSISYEQSQQIGLEEKLFGPAGSNGSNEVYVARNQMFELAHEMYSTLNIIEEYQMQETKFSDAFVNDFISQLASRQFNQVPTDTVLATISKYSFDIGADLRPEIIKKDIGSLLSINKTDEKSRIIFDVKRYNDWANSDKLSGSSRGSLIGLLKGSFGAAADISSRGTTNDQTLSDQMHELNTLSQNEAKWEIEGEKIIPKSLNVARILRSNMKTSLTFNRIRSKQFHVPFERNVKIYTSRSSQILCQNISTTKEIGPYEEMLESMSRNILYLMNASRVCPVGFHYLAEIDQCLRLNTLAMSWNDADRACREMATGGQLVMITSGVKQDAVKRYLERQFAELQPADCFHPYWQAKTAWISGQRQNPNRCDTPFVWKYNRGSDIPFTFTKWADRTFGCNGPDHAGQCVHNQPDCSNNEEHCAHIMSFLDYSWNDERCTASYCSVCAI